MWVFVVIGYLLLVGLAGFLLYFIAPGVGPQVAFYDRYGGILPEPAQVDLQNVIVEQFSVVRKYARPLARQGMEELERAACQSQYVPGNARNVHVNIRIEGLTSEPVLLPVWIMAYRYGEELFRFLVNGQSGRATGRAPLSWRKIGSAIGIGVAAVVAIVVIVLLMKLAR